MPYINFNFSLLRFVIPRYIFESVPLSVLCFLPITLPLKEPFEGSQYPYYTTRDFPLAPIASLRATVSLNHSAPERAL
jgi:hypothetical protein